MTSVEICLAAAVKAGAYKQAVELLRALRRGDTDGRTAFVIRLSIGWDWE